MRRVSVVPDQLETKQKQTMGGRGGGEGLGSSCRTPTGGGRSRRRRSGVRGHGRGWGGEIVSRAAKSSVFANVCSETRAPPVCGWQKERWCKRGKISSHTEFRSSLIKAWQLDFSVRIHIFLYMCLHFSRVWNQQPTCLHAGESVCFGG